MESKQYFHQLFITVITSSHSTSLTSKATNKIPLLGVLFTSNSIIWNFNFSAQTCKHRKKENVSAICHTKY